MKRFATVLAATAITVFAGSSTALAGVDDAYPPEDDVVLLLSSSSVGPGEEFTATLEGCTDGETVVFSVEGDSASAVCTNGSASASLTAPTTPGTYTVTAEGMTSGVSDSSEITVTGDDDDGDGGTLPETGSSSAGTIAQVGAGLLVCGLGLIAVSRLRRNRPIGA